jgi:gas vesicle protein
MDREHHSEHHKHHDEHHAFEQPKHRRHTGRWLKGFLYGAAAGVVASLLVAPQSGQQTRDLLRYKATQFRMTAEQKAEEARERAAQLRDEARTQVRSMSQKSKEYVGEQKERVSRVAQAATTAAKETWQETDPAREAEKRATDMVTPRL